MNCLSLRRVPTLSNPKVPSLIKVALRITQKTRAILMPFITQPLHRNSGTASTWRCPWCWAARRHASPDGVMHRNGPTQAQKSPWSELNRHGNGGECGSRRRRAFPEQPGESWSDVQGSYCLISPLRLVSQLCRDLHIRLQIYESSILIGAPTPRYIC